jgi:hypothetical protein
MEDTTHHEGVYIGTNGIKLGQNFSVTDEGIVSATQFNYLETSGQNTYKNIQDGNNNCDDAYLIVGKSAIDSIYSGQSNWNPSGGSNGEGLMEYVGKGYYYKKITFDELTGEKAAAFKAVFGGGWDKEGDFGNGGSNYVVTVPAGSTYVEIIADATNKKIYTSVEHPEAIAAILKGESPVAKPAEMEIIDGKTKPSFPKITRQSTEQAMPTIAGK